MKRGVSVEGVIDAVAAIASVCAALVVAPVSGWQIPAGVAAILLIRMLVVVLSRRPQGYGPSGSRSALPVPDAADRYAAIGALTEHFADALNAPLGTLVSAVTYAESTASRISETAALQSVEGGQALLEDLSEALRLARAATKQSRELSLRVREIIDHRRIGPPVPIDLGHLAARIVERLAVAVPRLADHVEILSMLGRPFVTYVEVIEFALEEIIRNALVHGYGVDIADGKASNDGADAKLKNARIQIGIGPSGTDAHIRIWNNGTKMVGGPQVRTMPRDPRRVTANSRARGLGLFATSYLLRTVTGGSLEIDPRSGEGVAVLIVLPEAVSP